MATKVLPGGISGRVRVIEKPDDIHIQVHPTGEQKLVVIEEGDARMLPISVAVAEVLIASGISYGS